MSDTTQAPQNPVKVDQRKIMTEEKLERLAKARETRARNRLMREEKRMELAKQMILASAGHPDTKPKSNPEEKKLKWEARKDEMIQEMLQKIGEANMRWRKEKELAVQPEESESEISDEPPAKRPKKSKTVAKPRPQKIKKSSSYTDTSDRAPKKRKPVKPAVSSTEESSESDVEHENILQLW